MVFSAEEDAEEKCVPTDVLVERSGLERAGSFNAVCKLIKT